MSSRATAAGVIVGSGLLYLGALAVAEVVAFALLATFVAAIVGVVVVGIALVGWFNCLREAVDTRDHAWVRDLFLAPALGLGAAVWFGQTVGGWLSEFEDSAWREHYDAVLHHGWPLVGAIIVGPVMFCLFLALLFIVPSSLAGGQGARLFVAYPGFIFFSCYLTGLALVWNS